MRVEKVVSPPLDNNAYFLFDETSKLAAVVDPALAGRALLANSEKFGVKIVYILNTHGHPDSIADDESIRSATGAKIAHRGTRDNGRRSRGTSIGGTR